MYVGTIRSRRAGRSQVVYTLLHISDLHLGPPFVRHVAEELVRTAHRIQPDIIVCSGDFTQRAKQHQFADARALLDRLPDVPLIVVPGNHDVPLYRIFERLTDPYRYYRRFIHEELDHVTRMDGLIIVALNSTSPYRNISNGRIHLDQLEMCEDILRHEPEETIKVVVSHHHFAPSPDYERDQVMPKSKRALDRLISLKVDLILGGHLHRAYIGNSLDVYRGADPEHGIVIAQCGTTTSRRGRGREREKNSLNLVRLSPETIEVTHHIFFEELERFAPTSRHTFPRPFRRILGA